MSKEAIFSKVQEIVSEQLGVESQEVVPTANFANDLGADSLDTVELVMALEEAFSIEIPDEAAEGITTVNDGRLHLREDWSINSPSNDLSLRCRFVSSLVVN